MESKKEYDKENKTNKNKWNEDKIIVKGLYSCSNIALV